MRVSFVNWAGGSYARAHTMSDTQTNDGGTMLTEPPDEDGDDDRPVRWVTVATFWQAPEAHIARLKLEAEDIECVITDENIVATDWLYALAVGGIKVRVPDGSADAACAILNLAAPPPLIVAGVCPECGAEDLSRPVLQRKTFWVALATVMINPLILPGLVLLVCYLIAWRPWRCPSCGNTFPPGSARRGFPVIIPDEKDNPLEDKR